MAPGFSQDTAGTYDLESCIQIAIQRSLDAEQARLGSDQSELNYKQAKYNMLPDFSAAAGQFYQSGRSIDRFTNTYAQQTIASNNFSASSSIILFAGGQLMNTEKASKYTWLASEYDVANTERNIGLSVSNYFLQIAQAKQQIASAENNLNNTKLQLERVQKQFEAGVGNEGNVLGLKAQLATDESNLILAKNQEITALTSLKLLLRLPAEQPFNILLPKTEAISAGKYAIDIQGIYDTAISHRPDVKAAELREIASAYRLKAVKGKYYPTLSVGGSLSSVFSSSAKEPIGIKASGYQTIGRVQGSNDLVEVPFTSYNTQTISFANQVKNNFGQSLGFNLSVPVFNKFNTETSVKLAGIDMEISKINSERARQNMYNEITTAYNAYESARTRFDAAIQSHKAQKLNLDFQQKRFDLGAGTFTDLQLARAAESTAMNTLISTRFEFIFRKLVLDYYMGKKLELN